MDYRYLKAFNSVGLHLNFTRAARELGLTQAAISRQIRLLEESIGQQLILRSPQRVELTPAGQRLFEESARFDAWIREDWAHGTRTVRIAALQGVLETWLTRVIREAFAETKANFVIRTGTLDEIDDAIRSGRVDISISSRVPKDGRLTSFRLFRERIVAVSRKPIALENLARLPWVAFDPETYLVPFCNGARSPRLIQVESIHACLSLVEAGAGVTLLPTHVIDRPERFHILPIERFKNETIWATTLAYARAPEHLRDFLQRLRTAAQLGQE